MRKIGEVSNAIGILPPVSVTNNTLYNSTASGAGLDTSSYDDIVYHCNVGAITSPQTLTVTIVESDTDDISAATAITGAAFTVANNANQNTVRNGQVATKGQKKYQWARTVGSSSTAGGIIGITAIGGNAISNPPGATYDFDV